MGFLADPGGLLLRRPAPSGFHPSTHRHDASDRPTWYEALQGAIGVAQFLVALAMFSGYRKAGPWGEF